MTNNNNDELPEIEFNVNSSGVTIFCTQLITPRFVPFDQKGKCPLCKSDNVELSYIIQTEGITLVCPRFKKDKFVQFDANGKPSSLREITNCRIKSRNKTYNFPIFERDIREMSFSEDTRKRKKIELLEMNEVIDVEDHGEPRTSLIPEPLPSNLTDAQSTQISPSQSVPTPNSDISPPPDLISEIPQIIVQDSK